MGKLAQAVFNALSPDDSFHSAERNTSRTVQECRYQPVKSVRPLPVVVLFSLGKKSQHRELH
jgi:hypothetical protein